MRISRAQPERLVDRGDALFGAAHITKRLPESKVALGEAWDKPQCVAQVFDPTLRLAAECPCPAECQMRCRLTVVERGRTFSQRRRVGDPIAPLLKRAIPAELYMDISKARIGLGKSGFEVDRSLEQLFGNPQILKIKLVEVP